MQHPPDEVTTKHSAKRISTLNEHEGHFLRRRLDAYKKVHDKEINDVASHLEEIRETVKSLSTDPSYGTHAVPTSPSSTARNARHVPAKGRLKRTRSSPEVKLAQETHRSFPLISGKNHKHGMASGYHVQGLNPVSSGGGAAMAHEPLRRIAGQPSSPTAAASAMFPVHKKVERSKTAPITILQPLLKTTPEMMKKKILISNSPRQPFHPKTPSPPRSDGADSSLDSSAAGRGRPSTGVRRKVIPSPCDLETNPNSQAESLVQNSKTPSPASRSSSVNAHYEPSSKTQRNQFEDIQAPARLARDVWSSSSTPVNHETRFTVKHGDREMAPRVNTAKKVDDHDSSRSITKDLKQCRYLQFVKDRLEDNFI